jgi:hypothetical protein
MMKIAHFQGEIIAKMQKIYRKFSKIFFSRTSRPNLIKLNTNYRWMKGIWICSNKGPGPLQRGENHKNVKMGWDHLKIVFSRTTGPILTRLGKKHRSVKGIQVCSNKWDNPSPRGDNSERVKLHWFFFFFLNLLLQNQQAKFNQT